jgi:hypothetical protein
VTFKVSDANGRRFGGDFGGNVTVNDNTELRWVGGNVGFAAGKTLTVDAGGTFTAIAGQRNSFGDAAKKWTLQNNRGGLVTIASGHISGATIQGAGTVSKPPPSRPTPSTAPDDDDDPWSEDEAQDAIDFVDQGSYSDPLAVIDGDVENDDGNGNGGSFLVQYGEIEVTGNFSQLASNSYTEVDSGAELAVDGSELDDVEGQVMLDGAIVQGTVFLGNQGQMTANGTAQIQGALQNNGQLEVQSGSLEVTSMEQGTQGWTAQTFVGAGTQLLVDGSYYTYGGTLSIAGTVVVGTVLNNQSALSLNGGTIKGGLSNDATVTVVGSSWVDGDFLNIGGIVDVGSGSLEVGDPNAGGQFENVNGGIIEVAVSANSDGSLSVGSINVLGQANTYGTWLDILFENYTPQAGDVYDILYYQSGGGGGVFINPISPGPGLAWQYSWTGSYLELDVVPA